MPVWGLSPKEGLAAFTSVLLGEPAVKSTAAVLERPGAKVTWSGNSDTCRGYVESHVKIPREGAAYAEATWRGHVGRERLYNGERRN